MHLVVIAIVLTATVAAVAPADHYDSRFDKLDVDALLSNERAMKSYVQCLLDKGPCTAEGTAFRKNLPDALETHCSKCTPAQKTIIRKTAKHLMEHRPQEWQQIKDKFDPKGQHHDTFQAFLKASS